MEIAVLSENTALDNRFQTEHGLSLLIQTGQRKILFDMGSSCVFKDNALALGLDIGQVDWAVLSHGHYDHGGGLCGLLRFNDKAPVYVSPYAFGNYYSQSSGGDMKYAGLNIEFAFHPRLQVAAPCQEIDRQTLLFTTPQAVYPLPRQNSRLFVKTDSGYQLDNFAHEQSLLLEEKGKLVLFAGCAHRGILNIMERCRELRGRYPDYVVSGMHLYSHSTLQTEPAETLHSLAEALLERPSQYYTLHCTGAKAFGILKQCMGDRIDYLPAGRTILLE